MLGCKSILTVTFCLFLVGLTSKRQYDFAAKFWAKNSVFQCGHLVYLRATQLCGVPITPEMLSELPSRKDGISLGELKSAFDDIGLSAIIEYQKDVSLIPELAVCKLDNPDHLVLVQKTDASSQITVFSDTGRPINVHFEDFSKRFSGFFLRLTATGHAVRGIASQNGPLPQFETLLIDTGNLKYKDYVKKPVILDFKLVNAGDQPLVIKSVKATCDCTNSTFPSEPIEPGESSCIRVEYRSQIGNSDGVFNQVLYAETNSLEFPFVRLEISGTFPGRMETKPQNINLELTSSGKVKAYVFANVPIPYDLKRIKARIVGMNEQKVDWTNIYEVDIESYNLDCKQRDDNFFPVLERIGLKLFCVEFHPVPKGTTRLICEVYDEQDELGLRTSSITLVNTD